VDGLSAEFRSMELSDVATLAVLEAGIYDTPWSQGVFVEELSQSNRIYLVAENGSGGIVGYGGLLLVDEDAHITTLAVIPEARGNGLGTRLMLALTDAAVTAGAAHLTLEVRLSNAPAQRLYRRFGFAPVGLRKNYYRDEDALVMWAIDIDTEEYRDRLQQIAEGLA
jgi:ribosomal-protein-alanine N-acetyltransferase